MKRMHSATSKAMSLGAIVTLTLLATSALTKVNARAYVVAKEGYTSGAQKVSNDMKRNIVVQRGNDVKESAGRGLGGRKIRGIAKTVSQKVAPVLGAALNLDSAHQEEEESLAQDIARTYARNNTPDGTNPYFMETKNGEINETFVTFNEVETTLEKNKDSGHICAGTDDAFWVRNSGEMAKTFGDFYKMAQENATPYGFEDLSALTQGFRHLMADDIGATCDIDSYLITLSNRGRKPLNLAMTLLWNMNEPTWSAMIKEMAKVLDSGTLYEDLLLVSMGRSLYNRQPLGSWDNETLTGEVLARYKDLCLVLAFMATWKYLDRDISTQTKMLKIMDRATDSRKALIQYMESFWAQDAAVADTMAQTPWMLERSYNPTYRWVNYGEDMHQTQKSSKLKA